MTILVAGASGATGLMLVEQLLNRGHKVKAIVRSSEKFSDRLKKNENLILIKTSLLDLSDKEMEDHLKGCDGVASCLGHNLTFKGLFGPPRKLVTDAVRRLCQAVESNKPEKPVRFVLMNTTGNKNINLREKRSLGESIVISLIRLLLPPHSDNEKAAEYLRSNIGQNNKFIQWTAVRPDGLIDEDKVTPSSVHPSPVRSPIFNPGKTSRINVGHFMAELLTDDTTWDKWKGQMPVIYNSSSI
jgi:nucleoside-diphosphate-sugar epimerase